MELREFLISDAYVVTAQILSFISFGAFLFICVSNLYLFLSFFRFLRK